MRNSIRFQLVSEYLDELQAIKGLPKTTEIKKYEYYQEVSNSKTTSWFDIYPSKEETDPVGFLIIGYPPNCHPNADFYIEEAYIQPKYRQQHYMTTTATRFIQAHPGTYCLFILNNNHTAKRFWIALFAKLGYVPCYLSDVGAGDEYCTQYGFTPGMSVNKNINER